MAEKIISLTTEEIQAGSLITERGKFHRAAFQTLSDLETDYLDQLRRKYGLNESYQLLDWAIGFVRVQEEQDDGSNH